MAACDHVEEEKQNCQRNCSERKASALKTSHRARRTLHGGRAKRSKLLDGDFKGARKVGRSQ